MRYDVLTEPVTICDWLNHCIKTKKDMDIRKSLISPPGDTLKEHLDFIGMSSDELAKRLNLSQGKMQDIILGRAPISVEIATKLENVLQIPSSFWLNREKDYQQELSDSRD